MSDIIGLIDDNVPVSDDSALDARWGASRELRRNLPLPIIDSNYGCLEVANPDVAQQRKKFSGWETSGFW